MIEQKFEKVEGFTSLYGLLLRVFAVAEALDKDILENFETYLKIFFSQDRNSEIRLFFGYSGNFGHKANTVNIMNQLITYYPEDKDRTIRIIYDIDPGEDEPENPEYPTQFAEALSKLIPGLPASDVENATPYALTDKITLEFNSYDPSKDSNQFNPALPSTGCLFAITGGFDESENLCKTINCEYFLSLNPYQFTKYKALNTIYTSTMDPEDNEGTLLGPVYDWDGTTIEDNKTGYYGKTFTKRAFYLPDPELTEDLWLSYKKQDEERYNYVRPIVEELIELSQQGTIQVMPLYYSQGRILCTNTELLLNMTSGLMEMKRLRSESTLENTCSFVVVFGGPDSIDFSNFDKLILNGDEQYPELNKFISKNQEAYNKNYRYLADNASLEEIQSTVKELGGDGVIIYRLGKVPLFLNEYMTTVLAGLPAVYEGEGSASIILNYGKPFLHLVSSDLKGVEDEDGASAITVNQLYPTIPLSSQNSDIANECHTSSLGMVQTYAQWNSVIPKDDELNPNEVVGQFIYESYVENTNKYNYFGSMRDFFHNKIQDKLTFGLIYIIGEIPLIESN
ncbi:MAG: hypothetical protein AAGA77_16215 [Bacteroidota bacterium]